MQKQEIIVIGDVHGEHRWKDIVEEHPGGRFVFLGDYCDPYDKNVPDNEVVENLKQIIQFKKEHFDNVTLLLGNHDVQYIYDKIPVCSRFMVYSMGEINAMFKNNISLFKKIYCFKNLLFTHAGVTEEWFCTAFPCGERKNIASVIDKSSREKQLFSCGVARGGRELYGGIFWADRHEFVNPLNGWIQVVGHSRVTDILLRRTAESTAIFFCDCLQHSKYMIIGQNEDIANFYAAQIGVEDKALLCSVRLKD